MGYLIMYLLFILVFISIYVIINVIVNVNSIVLPLISIIQYYYQYLHIIFISIYYYMAFI